MKKTDEVFLVLPGDKVPPNLRRVMPFLLFALIIGGLMSVSFSRPAKPASSGKLQVHTKLEGTVAGHNVRVDIDGSAFLMSGPRGAGIEFLRHTLVIEEDRLLFDGNESASIPATAQLDVVVSGNKLNVATDGKKVLSTKFRR